MRTRNLLRLLLLTAALLIAHKWPAPLRAADDALPKGALLPAAISAVGEQVPSEDNVIKDFHSLGLINGRTNIFRCASPVKDLIDDAAINEPSLDEAKARLRAFTIWASEPSFPWRIRLRQAPERSKLAS